MSDPSLPPPGWYGDPAGVAGSRWWDGTVWTDHVRDRPPGDDPPPLPDGVVPADASSLPLALGGRGRLTALVLFGVLVVGLVATAVIGLGNPGPAGRDGQPLGQVLPGAQVPPPMHRDDVEARADAAGCEVAVDDEPLEDATHLDPDDAPPPDALYPDRPAHSGRHYGTVLPLPVGVATVPVDERAVLHNMEHGAVVLWFDPDVVDGAVVDAIGDWWRLRTDLGFTSRAGGAVFASPMPELADAPAIALRAWGVAMDCERFDPLVADGFLADHFGTEGDAPEADLSPYPEGSLAYRERA